MAATIQKIYFAILSVKNGYNQDFWPATLVLDTIIKQIFLWRIASLPFDSRMRENQIILSEPAASLLYVCTYLNSQVDNETSVIKGLVENK